MIQNQVINYLLKTKDSSIITMNSLTDDYFSEYKSEFNFIKNHLNQYGNIPDFPTFVNVFPSFDVLDVCETPSYLLEALSDDRKKRFLIDNYNKVREAMLNEDFEKSLKLLKEASEYSVQLKSIQSIDLIHDTRQRYDAYMDKVNNPGKYFVTTGFEELDMILGGWNKDEDVVTIVARNGVGKSWVLLKCATAAAIQGKNVGIFSGEMSEDTVGYRMDSIIGHVSNGALVHGGASVKNEYKTFLEQLENCEGHLRVITPKMIGGPATVSALRAFVEKENLDALFIDQHSLLQDERGGKSSPEKASNISTDIKNLQTMKRIPIICVAQQNREKTDSGVQDSTQIGLSDKIGQDSSIILYLTKKDDVMDIYIGKSRNSGCGHVLSYRIDLNKGIWDYIPNEDNPLPSSSNSNFADQPSIDEYNTDTDVF